MNTVERVYDLIEERGISLYQLARMSGVSYSTVKTTEKRGGQLTVDTIERMSCHLAHSSQCSRNRLSQSNMGR